MAKEPTGNSSNNNTHNKALITLCSTIITTPTGTRTPGLRASQAKLTELRVITAKHPSKFVNSKKHPALDLSKDQDGAKQTGRDRAKNCQPRGATTGARDETEQGFNFSGASPRNTGAVIAAGHQCFKTRPTNGADSVHDKLTELINFYRAHLENQASPINQGSRIQRPHERTNWTTSASKTLSWADTVSAIRN
jgi:hypothetical protein